MRRRQPLARVTAAAVAVLIAAVVSVWWSAGPAQAHATLESTTPGIGSLVATAPHVVTASFDESVGVSSDSLRVFGPDGKRVDEGGTHQGSRASTIRISLRSGLAEGTYTVAWHVVSADSHPVQGAFTFSIGRASGHIASSSVRPPGHQTVSFLYALVRGLGYLGYAVLLGGLALVALCWPAGLAARRARVLLGAAGMVAVLASVAAFLLQGVYAAERGLGDLVSADVLHATVITRVGHADIARVLLLALVAGAVVLGRRRPRATRTDVGVVGALTVLIALTWALSDHSSVGRQVPLAVLADTVHLSAVACWVGGLTLLVTTVTARDQDVGIAQAVLDRFSPIAGGCVVLIVLTGTYQSWRDVGHWAAFVDTTYGVLLLAKIAGLVALVLLGYNARRLIGHTAVLSRRRSGARVTDLRVLRRSLLLEVGVVIGVLAATAVLVNSPTGRESYHPNVDVTRTFHTGSKSGTVELALAPARLGPQVVHLTVRDSSGRPYSPRQVTASLSLPSGRLGPLDLTLHRSSPGHYRSASQTVAVAGDWVVAVTVRSDAFDEDAVSLPAPIG